MGKVLNAISGLWGAPVKPVKVDVDDEERPGRSALGELGAVGSDIFGGLLQQQDYNPVWSYDNRYKLIEEMIVSSDVHSALEAVKGPLKSANWEIVPGDESAAAKEAAKLVEEDLFASPTHTWEYVLRHALMMIEYGNMLFEKVWNLDGERVRLAKLAPRLPRTICEYVMTDQGVLQSVVQQVGSRSDGQPTRVEIPAHRLLLFVHDQRGADMRGRSILRAAYKPWYMVDKLEIIDAIGGEKHGMGIDVASIKSGAKDGDISAIRAAMRSLTHRDKQYVIEDPERWTYRIETPQGTVHDVKGSVKHHQQKIFRAMFADFLGMGEGRLGSHSLSEDKTSMLMLKLVGLGRDITGTFNRQLIAPWHRWNFGDDVPPPKLKHNRLDTRDLVAFVTALAQGANSGLLTPDDDLENEIREAGSIKRKEAGRPRANRPGGVAPRPFPGAGRGRGSEAAGVSEARLAGADVAGEEVPFSDLERHVNFARMESVLDGAEEEAVSSARAVLEVVIDDLIGQAEEAFESEAGGLRDLESIQPIGEDELEEAISGVLRGLYVQGRKEVVEERARQRGETELALDEPIDPADLAEIDEYLGVRGRSVAVRLLERFRAAFLLEVVRQAKAGRGLEAGLLLTLMQNLADTELRKDVRLLSSEALGLGRQAQQKEFEGGAVDAELSARLDSNTCSPCREANGLHFKPFSAEYEAHYPPFSDPSKAVYCEGRDQCRCLMLVRYETEQPAS
jgi:hypothetical protein